MTIEIKKTDSTCGDIDLIDENLCVGNSLSIINSNVVSLSSRLNNLLTDVNKWNSVYTLFNQSSSAMFSTVLNIKKINESYQSHVSVVQSLSANWNKEFSVYYPKIINMASTIAGSNQVTPGDWYTDANNIQSGNLTKLQNWMKINFPPSEYIEGQIVNLFVSLYETIYFNFYFYRNYYEYCVPNKIVGYNNTDGAAVSCNGCGADPRQAGCNHHNNNDGTGDWCGNPYDHCGHSYTKDVQKGNCTGNGGRLLEIEKNKTLSDRHLSRVVVLYLKNDGTNWNYISLEDKEQ